ncbi:MAG: hypothetical protein DSM106950_24305 [Stigonema ocellatum SAG 48.90 = DSM 106950]|nr:hypothetical protein [Stigonema ocellatum SAG 48.90 = DSM 106950]
MTTNQPQPEQNRLDRLEARLDQLVTVTEALVQTTRTYALYKSTIMCITKLRRLPRCLVPGLPPGDVIKEGCCLPLNAEAEPCNENVMHSLHSLSAPTFHSKL